MGCKLVHFWYWEDYLSYLLAIALGGMILTIATYFMQVAILPICMPS